MATPISLDDLPCAVVTAALSGKIETANSTLEAWTGRRKADLLGMPLKELLDESQTPALLKRVDGSPLEVSVSSSGASPRVLVLTPSDDQARKHDALSALEDANALLDTIFETAPIGLGVWDKDLRFVRVNKRLAEINGVPPEAHIGKQPHELLPEIVGVEEIYSRWQEIFAKGESWNNVEVKGATPAAPGLIRTWDENFYPIKVQDRVIGIGAVVEETTERKRNLEHVKSLVKELNHRCKNLLSIVLAIARQTSRGADPDEFISRFTNRIQGLVASHDLLVRGDWTGVAIADLVKGQLAPFDDQFGRRIFATGPFVRLRPAPAQGLGMALHELATNAAKYGALSNSTGTIGISWDVLPPDGSPGAEHRLILSWKERDGPRVVSPERAGFGQLVIGKLLEASMNGKTKIAFAPEGVMWSLSAPTPGILEP